MTGIEITMTARVKLTDAKNWAFEWGVELEDVADDVREYIRHNVGAGVPGVTIEWK